MYNPIEICYRIEAKGYKPKLYRGGIAQAIQFGEWLQKIGYENVTIQGRSPESWRNNP